MDASTGSGTSSPRAGCRSTCTSKIRSIHRTASRKPPAAASHACIGALRYHRAPWPSTPSAMSKAAGTRSERVWVVDARRSELLLEGTHVHLLRPRARVLVRDVPVRLGDRRRLQHVLLREVGAELVDEGHVDRAVDVHVGNVDALRAEVARNRLRQAAEGELRGPEGCRGGERLGPRGRAREEDHAPSPGEHGGGDRPRPTESDGYIFPARCL